MREFFKSHKSGIYLLLALAFGVVVIWLSGGCLIYRIFHVECLSCGMTHALISAIKLDFRKAFLYHPMFWSTPLIAAYIVFEGKPFKKKAVNIAVLAIIVAGFVVQYVLKRVGIIVYPR